MKAPKFGKGPIRLYRYFLISSVFLMIAFQGYTQKNSGEVERGKLYLTPLPIVGSNPSYGFIYGAAASANMYLGDVATTRMSTSSASLTYTTKKQLISLIKSNLYLNNDEWILFGDWRFFDTSQPTFGLGTGPQSQKLATQGFEYEGGFLTEPIPDEQLMEFTFFRFHETALKKIKKGFYAGLGLHLDYHYKIQDELLDTTASPPVVTSHYAYSVGYGFDPEKYQTNGISVNAVYDRRDNPATPYSGEFIWIRYRINPEFFRKLSIIDRSVGGIPRLLRPKPAATAQPPFRHLGLWAFYDHRATPLPSLALSGLGPLRSIRKGIYARPFQR